MMKVIWMRKIITQPKTDAERLHQDQMSVAETADLIYKELFKWEYSPAEKTMEKKHLQIH